MNQNLLEHFSDIKDPRIERNKLHQLSDIIFLTISAVLSGADGWEAIAEFGQNKLEWLQRFVPLENGM
ncbi:MAG: transposase family protein [Methylococcales bacterium]